MTYDTTQARRELLNTVGEAADALGRAIAALGEAYEQLDENNADFLEEQIFRPVQTAYGRAQRTHAGFAARHGLQGRDFAPAMRGHPSQGVAAFVDAAVGEVAEAELILVTLQDSLRPVEVGDDELRAGLSEVRRLLGDVPGRARRFQSLLGR